MASLDFSVVGITWRVHRGPSLPVYELHRLDELRGFLSTGQITPADQISHDGSRWIDIASITDLEAYFWSVWQNALNPGADPVDVPTVLASQHEASAARLEAEVTETPDDAQAAWFSANTILPVDDAQAALASQGRAAPTGQSFDLLGQNTGTSEAIVPTIDSGTPPPPQRRASPTPVPMPARASVPAADPPPQPQATDAPPLSPSPALPRVASVPPSEERTVTAAHRPTITPEAAPAPARPPEPERPPALRAATPTVVPVEPPHLEAPGSYGARGPAPLSGSSEAPAPASAPTRVPLTAEVDMEASGVFMKGDIGFSEEDLDDPPRVGGVQSGNYVRPESNADGAPGPAPLRQQPSESVRPSLLRGGPTAPLPNVLVQPPSAPGAAPVRSSGRRARWTRSTSVMAAAFAGGVSLTIGAFTVALIVAAMVGLSSDSEPVPEIEGLRPRADATESVIVQPSVAPGTREEIPAPPPRRSTRRRSSSSRGAATGVVSPQAAPAPASTDAPPPPEPSLGSEPPGIPEDLEREDPLPEPAIPDGEMLGLPDDLLGQDGGVATPAPEVAPPEDLPALLPLKEEASPSEPERAPGPDAPADGG